MKATVLELLIKSFKNKEILSSQERETVWNAIENSTKEIAKEQLKSEGYAVDNLWSTFDIDQVLKDRGIEMDVEGKLNLLNNVLSNDWITGEIWESLKIHLD